MKNLLFAVALLFGGLSEGWAKSAEDLQAAWYGQSNVGERVASNNSLAANLFYVGTATEAVVTIGTGAITSYAPYNVIDTALNFDLTAAANDTFGELCDKIDALTNYECKLKGAKRDDNTNLLRDQTQTSGTNDLKTAGGFDVRFDTGSVSGALTDVFIERIGITPEKGKRVIINACTANVNVIGTFDVYGRLRKYEGKDTPVRNDTTLVWSVATADDTDLTQTFSVADGTAGLEFGVDEHVVINGSSTTGIQAAANFLRCSWIER